METSAGAVSRLLVGKPMRSDRLEETLLPKRLALPVFCSDPLSSVAYATEQILLVLGLGGLAMLHLTAWVGLSVVALLLIVVLSYRQTCIAYPNGGGAYTVSRDNLGENAALTAAAALLIDYVLTVAVSVVAGVAAITSAVPSLAPDAVQLSVGFVVLLSIMNLRGVRESGRAFAIPTYGFVAAILLLIGVGLIRILIGDGLTAESAGYGIRHTTEPAGALAVFLVLRAFASGCTALTGVEAVSNGIPAFQPPKSENAAKTLLIMGSLAIVMFAGITALAIVAHVHMAENPANLIGLPHGAEQKTALSQLGLAAFGQGPLFYLLQGFTAAILVLAANTAFNGFPVLSSLLGRHQYMPHQLANRGDRLVFSNGIILLAAVAILLIIAFDANVTRLIQLYILGVFLSFTLSQAGMVRHWSGLIATAGSTERGALARKRLLNGVGAVVTGLVFVIVIVTKFSHGAWIVVLAAPLLFAAMKTVSRHYSHLNSQLAATAAGSPLPSRIHTLVLVSNLLAPTLRALAFAQAGNPASLRAVTVASTEDAGGLPKEWRERGVPVPLVVIESPFRETVRPVLRYVRQVLRENPGDIVSVVIPEYVVEHWWQNLLHNQTALRLKGRLLFEPSVTVTSVPWVIR
jgi:amino acid transporter